MVSMVDASAVSQMRIQVLLIFVCLTGFCCSSGEDRASLAAIPSGVLDFGYVHRSPEGGVLQGRLTLSNTTRHPIAITGIRASCVCVHPETDKKLVGPGESTSLNVRVDVVSGRGPREYSIYVATDDPSASILVLNVRYVFQTGWFARPSVLSIKDAERGKSYERAIEIIGYPGVSDLTLQAVRAGSPSVKVLDYAKTGDRGGRPVWSISLNVIPNDLSVESTYLQVDDGNPTFAPETVIPVIIATRNPVAAEPPSLAIEEKTGYEPSWRKVSLCAANKGPIRVKVSVSDDRLEARLEPRSEDAVAATVFVRVKSTSERAFFGGRVFVQSADSQCRLIVPVLVRVR